MQFLKRSYWWLRVQAWLWIGRPAGRASRLWSLVPLSYWLAWPVLVRRTQGNLLVPITGLENPVTLRHGTSDFDVFRGVFLDGQYDVDVPGEVNSIVDCGANIGLTMLFFRLKYPRARIVGLEPQDDNWATAVRNVGDMTVHRAAVWSELGEVAVKMGEYRDGRHWAAQVEAGKGVPAVTIPDITSKHGITTIDILKIDIEGAERELFSGDTSWLKMVRCILIELHDDDCTAAFMRAIEPFGFSIEENGMTTVAVKRIPTGAGRAP